MVGGNETIDIPRDSSVGVLLLHGLFGTPNELHVLGGVLAEAGYRVRIPLLPGRGQHWDDLDRLAWEDVRDAMLAELDLVAREHDHVVLGGLSAGATLALDLALSRPPSALLLYAPALVLRRRIVALAPYLWRVVPRFPFTVDGPVRRDRIPTRAAGELVRGIHRVRRRLGEIVAPALVVHARADPLVDVSSAERIARELGGPVQLEVIDAPTHALTFGSEREHVAALTLTFLGAQVPATPRSGARAARP